MNTAELTALNTETLEAIRTERTLTNIARRAENLIADGYRVNHNNRPDAQGVNYVHGPKGQLYRVNTWDGSPEFPEPEHGCDCPAFAKFGTCKHYLCVKMLIAEDAAADAAFERAQEVRSFFDMSADRF